MNIKSVLPQVVKIEPRQKVEGQTGLRTDSTNKDRDGNGRQEPREEGRKTRLNQEEMEKVLSYLKALPGVVANSLSVSVEGEEGSIRVVYIRDLQGGIVRRIPEPDLWSLIKDQDRKTGQILDKAG